MTSVQIVITVMGVLSILFASAAIILNRKTQKLLKEVQETTRALDDIKVSRANERRTREI